MGNCVRRVADQDARLFPLAAATSRLAVMPGHPAKRSDALEVSSVAEFELGIGTSALASGNNCRFHLLVVS